MTDIDPSAQNLEPIQRRTRTAAGKRSPLANFAAFRYNREVVVLILLGIAFGVGTKLSPYFMDRDYLLDASSLYMETGLIALAMTFIIISGNIDLSVASTLALVASVTALLHAKAHLPFGAAMFLGLVLGGILGLCNGLMIVRLKLPSLAVTLGTFALYRGLAQILIGDHSVGEFPTWFAGIDYRHILGPIPAPLGIFLIGAFVFGLLLHKHILGRWTVAIGTNAAASRYTGIPNGAVIIGLFTLSGFMAGAAALMMESRLSVARFDMGTGLELDAITAVVLGGTDIFGGRGTIFGTVSALFLIGILKNAMGLANITVEKQLVVVGLLLIFSIVLPNLLQRRK